MEHGSGSDVWKFKKFVLLYLQVEVYQNMLKLRYWTPAFNLYKSFLKNKKVWN